MPSGKQDCVNNKIQHALANRVDRICLVLECCSDNKNYLACLRTCDILGVQNVWIVEEPLPASQKTKHNHVIDTTSANCRSHSNPSSDKRLPVEQVGVLLSTEMAIAGRLHLGRKTSVACQCDAFIISNSDTACGQIIMFSWPSWGNL